MNDPTDLNPVTGGVPKRILVVEDELVVRGALQQLLSGQGYEVITAADGSEALRQASGFTPDLILLDLGLPTDPFGGGIADGFGVMEWLRRGKQEKPIPIIVLTARQDPESRRRAIDLGASVYLTKPFKAAELFQAIRIVLDEA
jgi:DNA-binding response OmpR family regulator